MQQRSNVSVRALDDNALAWAGRCVWLVCIGIYLTVFVSGILGGGAELITMGRAAAFTLLAAYLGRIVLRILGQASLPVEQGLTDTQERTLGSLVDLVGSTNVGHHEDEANAA